MKTRVWLLVAVGLLMTGCASMYDGMGLATKDSVAAQVAKIQALETQVSDLSAKFDSLKDQTQRVAAVETLLKSLQGKVDLLPHETMRKLADILTKAADDLVAKP